jgi:hypothetical protein
MTEAPSPCARVLADRADAAAIGDREVRGPAFGAQVSAPGTMLHGAPLARADGPLPDGGDGTPPLPWIGLSLTVAFGASDASGGMPGGTPCTLLPCGDVQVRA